MKRFLGIWETEAKEFLKEKDPEKQREMAERVAAEMHRRIDYITQEEGALKEGTCSKLAERCAHCGRCVRLAGAYMFSIQSLYVGGYFACGQCRKETKKSGD